MAKKKQILDADSVTASLAILLENLKVIKLQVHRRSWLDLSPIPNTQIRGMTLTSGSIYYTAEKYNI